MTLSWLGDWEGSRKVFPKWRKIFALYMHLILEDDLTWLLFFIYLTLIWHSFYFPNKRMKLTFLTNISNGWFIVHWIQCIPTNKQKMYIYIYTNSNHYQKCRGSVVSQFVTNGREVEQSGRHIGQGKALPS